MFLYVGNEWAIFRCELTIPLWSAVQSMLYERETSDHLLRVQRGSSSGGTSLTGQFGRLRAILVIVSLIILMLTSARPSCQCASPAIASRAIPRPDNVSLTS